MPLTVYEKHSVKPNMKVVVYGKLTFNKLDEPRVQQPNEFVREPKPEYVVALTDVKFKGDEQLVSALQDTMITTKICLCMISRRFHQLFLGATIKASNQTMLSQKVKH